MYKQVWVKVPLGLGISNTWRGPLSRYSNFKTICKLFLSNNKKKTIPKRHLNNINSIIIIIIFLVIFNYLNKNTIVITTTELMNYILSDRHYVK